MAKGVESALRCKRLIEQYDCATFTADKQAATATGMARAVGRKTMASHFSLRKEAELLEGEAHRSGAAKHAAVRIHCMPAQQTLRSYQARSRVVEWY